jgi:uncharacterized membrane protein YhfC
VVVLEVILMVGLPVVAVLLVSRRWSLALPLALAGAATFIGSQILHIPANSALARVFNLQARPLLTQAIVLGLSAGVFEEVARYLVYRYWQKDARSWREAIFFGLGHGGIESIMLGGLVGLTLLNMVVIARVDNPALLGLPEAALAQVTEFWSMPLYLPLLAAAERVMAMVLHMSLSVLVLLCFHKGHLWPLVAAILWHALANAVAVYTAQTWGAVAAEGALAVVALLSVVLLWLTRRTLSQASMP